MKTWTVVIEIQDENEISVDVNKFVTTGMSLACNYNEMIGFRIMETIDAPYGPQLFQPPKRNIRCGMCGDTGLQNGIKCPQIGCIAAQNWQPPQPGRAGRIKT